jgi:hypothetical protein
MDCLRDMQEEHRHCAEIAAPTLRKVVRNCPVRGMGSGTAHKENEKRARGMKIAISSTGPDLADLVDPRFSRCSFYVFVDLETSEFQAVENTGARAQ